MTSLEIISHKLRDQACRESVIFQFASVSPSVPEGKSSKNAVDITVHEYGRGVECSPSDFERFDVENLVQKFLLRQMRVCIDRASWDALKGTDLKISSRCLDGLITQSTKFTANSVLGVVSDYMASHVVPYTGDSYIGVGGVRFIRDIKQDPDLQLWSTYLGEGDVLYHAEVGKSKRIRWIEVNDTTIGDGAVVFGDKALKIIEVKTPYLQLEADRGIVCWYGVLAYGIEKDRVVYIYND